MQRHPVRGNARPNGTFPFFPDVELDTRPAARFFTCWPAILWILGAISCSSDRVAARVLHALKSAAAARISPYSWMHALSALLGPTQPPGRRSAARAAALPLALSRHSPFPRDVLVALASPSLSPRRLGLGMIRSYGEA